MAGRSLSALLALLCSLCCALAMSVPPAAAEDGAVGGDRLGSTGLVVDRGSGTPALPSVGASSYVVADLDTGEVLAAKAPHVRYRPASTMKILTALTLLPELPDGAVYTAQDSDAAAVGTKVGILPGYRYTADQLFKAMLIMSGNDAAKALANLAGGMSRTVRQMNKTARDLRAEDTTARNSSGLDTKGQYTSAYDLALLGRAALASKRMSAYLTATTANFPGKGNSSYQISTINRLLYNFKGAIGVKTGWTTLARGTYVGAAKRDGHTLLASVMHTNSESWEDSAALLSWGFKAVGRVEPVGRLVEPRADTPAGANVSRAIAHGTNAATAPEETSSVLGTVTRWSLLVLLLLLVTVVALRVRAVRVARARRRLSAARAQPVSARAPAGRSAARSDDARRR